MTKTIDTDAESAQRAAQVDQGAAWNDGGSQGQAQRGGDDAEADAFAQLESKHGGGGGGPVEQGGPEDAYSDEAVEEFASDQPSGEEMFWEEGGSALGEKGDGRQARGQNGQFQRGDAGQQQEHGGAETDRESGAESETDTQAATLPSEAEIAGRRALIRDGWSRESVDGLPKDVLIREGINREGRQRIVDKQLDDRSHTTGAGGGQPFASGPAQGTPQAGDVQKADAIRALNDTLTEAYGDPDIAARAVAAFEKAFGAPPAPQQVSGAPVQSGQETLAGAMFERQSRSRLMDQYPQLKDDATWNRVNGEAQSLFQYQSAQGAALTPQQQMLLVDQSIDQAAAIHLGAPVPPKARQDRQTARNNRGPGSIQAPKRPAPPAQKFGSKEALDDAWLDAQDRGDRKRMDQLERIARTTRFPR